MKNLTAQQLVAFEHEMADLYLQAKVSYALHLSGGNEVQLVQIFEMIRPQDWVLCSHRNHFAALLKTGDPELVKTEILKGNSIHLSSKEHRFLSTGIVGGCLPIAVGIALGIKRAGHDSYSEEHVWCFVGDGAAATGNFYECSQYAARQKLPITFVIENNGLSVNSPTELIWGPLDGAEWWGHNGHPHVLRYDYTRGPWPHLGCGKWVVFS